MSIIRLRWLLLLVIFFVGTTGWILLEAHHTRQRYEQTCRETLALELRWVPRGRTAGLSTDPCEAIRMIRRDTR